MEAQSQILKKQYQLRFSELQEYRDQVWQILCSCYFSRFINRDSVILDLGAGWGEFVNHIDAARKYAMDLNPATPERLADGITFIHQDCSHPWGIESESLDVVFTSNFLEHLHDKSSIERTVVETHRCLKDGGLFICMGPNINYVPGAYWNFWDHHTPITDQSCKELLRMKGFSIVQCLARFLPYSMSGGSKLPMFLVKLYLKLPVFWSLFGKQFLVVGQKISPPTKQVKE